MAHTEQPNPNPKTLCLCVCMYVCIYIKKIKRNKQKHQKFTMHAHIYIYISRIRRNLSIHIARFSASESPRATYQHSQNSPIFASRLANRLRGCAVCVTTHGLSSQASVINSLLAFAICCVHYSSRLFNLFLPFNLHFMHLFLLLAFCD